MSGNAFNHQPLRHTHSTHHHCYTMCCCSMMRTTDCCSAAAAAAACTRPILCTVDEQQVQHTHSCAWLVSAAAWLAYRRPAVTPAVLPIFAAEAGVPWGFINPLGSPHLHCHCYCHVIVGLCTTPATVLGASTRLVGCCKRYVCQLFG